MAGKTILCLECRKPFEFSDKEREYLTQLVEEKKLPEVIEPKRCVDCRTRRRAARQPSPQPASRPVDAKVGVSPSVEPVAVEVQEERPNPVGQAPLPFERRPDATAEDFRIVLCGADFERLLCREELVFMQGARKARIILADIGFPAMKAALEHAMLKWLKS